MRADRDGKETCSTGWRHPEPFGPLVSAPLPSLVRQVAHRIRSPFFSIDVAERQDGVLRVVEIGDGAVSGLEPIRLSKAVAS